MSTPAYSPRNPKIDVYRRETDKALTYLFSTNYFRTCRDALAHYASRHDGTLKAFRDSRR